MGIKKKKGTKGMVLGPSRTTAKAGPKTRLVDFDWSYQPAAPPLRSIAMAQPLPIPASRIDTRVTVRPTDVCPHCHTPVRLYPISAQLRSNKGPAFAMQAPNGTWHDCLPPKVPQESFVDRWCPGVPAGWTVKAWTERLRYMAQVCVVPSRSRVLSNKADELERLATVSA
jgi:hypothetical protein